MKIKMKISYEACKSSISIVELFVNAMLKTYKRFFYNEFKNQLIKPEDGDSFIKEVSEYDDEEEEEELIYKENLDKKSVSLNIAKPIGFSPLTKVKQPLINKLKKVTRRVSRNKEQSHYEYPRLVRQDAESHLLTYSSDSSFNEEEFYNGFRTIL
jgi:hypothetical protein